MKKFVVIVTGNNRMTLTDDVFVAKAENKAAAIDHVLSQNRASVWRDYYRDMIVAVDTVTKKKLAAIEAAYRNAGERLCRDSSLHGGTDTLSKDEYWFWYQLFYNGQVIWRREQYLR